MTSRDIAFAPGRRWAYSNAGSNVISVVIRNVLRDRAAYLSFPTRALFGPLGMSSAVLETDAAADEAKRYGAHFWLEIPPEYAGAQPRLPVPALHAAGHEGQFVTIVPSRDLVIVRLGRTRYPHAWDHATFVREVMATIDRANP